MHIHTQCRALSLAQEDFANFTRKQKLKYPFYSCISGGVKQPIHICSADFDNREIWIVLRAKGTTWHQFNGRDPFIYI